MTKQTKKKNTGDRRYEPGKHRDYDHVYNRLSESSPILSKESRQRDHLNFTMFTDRKSVEVELVKQVGNSGSGYYLFQGHTQPSYVLIAENALADIHQQFKDWQQQRIREGKAYEPEKEWPKTMHQKRLELEARCDVKHMEANVLRQEWERLKAEEVKEKKKESIRRFPRLANQDISYSKSGIPFVGNTESPFYKMPLLEYTKMTNKWKKEHPGRRRVKPEQLPKWPENSKTIDQVEDELLEKRMKTG
ncbi:MAG: hypothetical protein WD097_09790 [Balneolales bacterium]